MLEHKSTHPCIPHDKHKKEKRVSELIKKMDGWMDGWTDRWTDRTAFSVLAIKQFLTVTLLLIDKKVHLHGGDPN